MKKSKRLISLFLALVMLLTALPAVSLTALAQNTCTTKIGTTINSTVSINGTNYTNPFTFCMVDIKGTDYFNFTFGGFDANKQRVLQTGQTLTVDIGMGRPVLGTYTSGQERTYGFHFGDSTSGFGVSSYNQWKLEVTSAPSGATVPTQASISGFGKDGVRTSGPVNPNDISGSTIDYRNDVTKNKDIATRLTTTAFTTPGTYNVRIYFTAQAWGWKGSYWSEYMGTQSSVGESYMPYITFTVIVKDTYNFVNYAGTTVSTQQQTSYDACTKPSNTASYTSTEKITGNNVNHDLATYTYSWGTPTQTSTGVYTVKETRTRTSVTQAHSFTGTGKEGTVSTPSSTTYTCGLCGYSYTVEGSTVSLQPLIDAYNAVKAEADSGKYTTSSANSVNTNIYNTYISVTGNSNQAAVDTAVTNINAQKSNLVEKADFSALEEIYAEADNLLLSLQDRDNSVYTYADVQALALVTQNGATTLSMDKNDTAKKDYQTTIDTNVQTIRTQLDALTAIDTSALSEALRLAEHYDKDIYTNEAVATAIAQAERIFSTYTYDDKTLYCLKAYSDDDISDATRILLEKLNESRVNYTITVSDNVELLSHPKNEDGTYTIPYGQEVVFQPITGYSKDVAWYMQFTSTTTSRAEQYQANGYQYRMKVIGDVTITARTKSADTYKVQMVKVYGESSTAPAVEKVFYTSGEYVLPVPKAIANYTFSRYEINGESKAVGDTVNITADTQIQIVYQYSSSKFDVQINDVSGTAQSTTAYAYNAKVKVSSSEPDVLAWVEKTGDTYRLFYWGTGFTFCVSETTTLQPVTKEGLESMGIDASSGYANLRQAGTVKVDTKVSFIGQFVLPEGASLKEKGILVAKPKDSSTAINPDDVFLENIPVTGEAVPDDISCVMKRCKSSTHTSANQFVISINSLTGDIVYRAYLIYQLADGKIVTVYSDAVSETV